MLGFDALGRLALGEAAGEELWTERPALSEPWTDSSAPSQSWIERPKSNEPWS